MSNQSLVPPKPDYQSRFPAYKHPRSTEVIASVQQYFSGEWPWPSEKHREKYLKQDIELWISYIAPHALDDRIEFATLWITFVFFVDDMLDSAPDEKGKDLCLRLISIVAGESIPNPEESATPGPLETIAIDLGTRLNALSAGVDSSKAAAARLKQKTIEFHRTLADSEQQAQALRNFDAYLEYRNTEVGNWIICAAIFWASGVTFPEELADSELIHTLEEAAGHHFIAVNDLYSYRKELRALQERNSPGTNSTSEGELMNSIPILMKEKQLDYDGVVQLLVEFLGAIEMRFLDAVKEGKAKYPEHGETIVKTSQCLAAFMAGNTTWSSICRRYNAL